MELLALWVLRERGIEPYDPGYVWMEFAHESLWDDEPRLAAHRQYARDVLAVNAAREGFTLTGPIDVHDIRHDDLRAAYTKHATVVSQPVDDVVLANLALIVTMAPTET